MPWALIDDGDGRAVVEVIDFDPTGIFAPDLRWLPCPDGTRQGDVWDVEAFGRPTPPPEPSAPRIISGEAFLDLFTPAETAALWNADPRLMRGAMRVMAQDSANLDSPEMAALAALAVARGVLTPERAARIVAGLPPETNATDGGGEAPQPDAPGETGAPPEEEMPTVEPAPPPA